MGDRSDCVLAVKGDLNPAHMERFWAVMDGIAEAGWEDDDPLTYIANGGGHFHFREMNYGELPPEIEAILTELGLSWAWHWDAGQDLTEGVRFWDAETGSDDQYHATDSEIVLTIGEAIHAENVALAAEWAAFWRTCGEITITDNNPKGGETDTDPLD